MSSAVAAPLPAALPAGTLSPGPSRGLATARVRSRSPRPGPLSLSIDKAGADDLPALAPRLADIVLARAGASALVAPFTHADAAALYDLALGVGPHKALLLVARTTAVPLRRGTSHTRAARRANGQAREGSGEGAGSEGVAGVEGTSSPAAGEAAERQRRGEVVGSVQLHFHAAPNGWFRADVRGLFVHPEYERRGVARRLMERLEEEAKACKVKLMLLDTEPDAPAQALFTSLGFTTTGIVPRYTYSVDGLLRDAALMHKELRCGNCDECGCPTEKKLQW